METRHKRREYFGIALFFTVFVFSILLLGGTITSGLHLVDDHEFFRYDYEMSQGHKTLWEIISYELEIDFMDRFRPLYYPLRILYTRIFGTNLVIMSVLRGIETVISCIVVYWIGRKLGCNMKYAVAMALFVMVGPQSAVWWKSGPQELTATWLFGLGILCLFWWKEKGRSIYNALAIVLFIFVSLYKESYIVLIPAVMLIYLYFSLHNLHKKEITVQAVGGAIKDNFVSLLILGTVLLAELVIIIFFVGTDSTGYGGIDLGMSWFEYVKVFLNNFRLPLRVGQYALFVAGILLLFRKNLKVVNECKWQLLLALGMVIPQWIIYSKTGLEERYVIPWIYGVAYFFVAVVCQLDWLNGKKRFLYDLFLGILLVGNLFLVFREARYFTYRGHGITRMFDEVMEMADEDTNILTAFSPYIESDNTAAIWFHTKGIDNVYTYQGGICVDWYENGRGNTIEFDEVDIILMYNYDDRHYLAEPELDFTDFDIEVFHTVRVAVRKDYL